MGIEGGADRSHEAQWKSPRGTAERGRDAGGSDLQDDPADDPVIDPVIDPIDDPVIDPVIDPIDDPLIDPVLDPTDDPVIDPVDDPALDPTDTPAPEPVLDMGLAYRDDSDNPEFANTTVAAAVYGGHPVDQARPDLIYTDSNDVNEQIRWAEWTGRVEAAEERHQAGLAAQQAGDLPDALAAMAQNLTAGDGPTERAEQMVEYIQAQNSVSADTLETLESGEPEPDLSMETGPDSPVLDAAPDLEATPDSDVDGSMGLDAGSE